MEGADYTSHFRVGKRVRVAIPLPDGAPFQEWGRVLTLQADLLEVELSRDSLPQQASLEVGRLVQLALVEKQRPLMCNGSIARRRDRSRLVLRLMGELLPYEPREFFRQDLSIPLEYRLPPSQFHEEIRERWRQSRWAQEFASQQPAAGESEEISALRGEILARLERRKGLPAIPANVSGGGLRVDLRERLRPGMLVELGIYLPQPQRVLEIVGEVVQVSPSSERERFSTAFRYRFIEEADRDRLIGYIATQQLQQLSQQAPQEAIKGGGAPSGRGTLLRIALGFLILAGLIGWQVHSILAARERGEKHEIARIFEGGLLDYLRHLR